jgi:hypothetical protein
MCIHALCIVSLVVVYLDLSLNSISMFKFKSICSFSFFFPPSLFSPLGPAQPALFSLSPFLPFSPGSPAQSPARGSLFFLSRARGPPASLAAAQSAPRSSLALSPFPSLWRWQGGPTCRGLPLPRARVGPELESELDPLLRAASASGPHAQAPAAAPI